MKVICIDGDWEGEGYCKNCPIEGEIYTVVDIRIDKNKIEWYELAEFFKETKNYIYTDEFESTAFIPLSDIDETELVNKEQSVNKVNI